MYYSNKMMTENPMHNDLDPINEETWRDFSEQSQIGPEYLQMKEDEEKRWCICENYTPSNKCLLITCGLLMTAVVGCVTYMLI